MNEQVSLCDADAELRSCLSGLLWTPSRSISPYSLQHLHKLDVADVNLKVPSWAIGTFIAVAGCVDHLTDLVPERLWME